MFNSNVEQSWRYWLQWQVPVCALIVAIPASLAIKFSKNSMEKPLLLTDLWTTHWKNLSPLWLLIYRAFAFVCSIQLLYEIVALHGPFVFFFYTQWTFALVAIYFALGTIVSAYGYWYPSKNSPSKNGEGAGCLGTLMQMSYLASAGASMLTDIVFWCLLVPFLLGEDFRVDLKRFRMKGVPVTFGTVLTVYWVTILLWLNNLKTALLLLFRIHSLNAIFLLGDTALNCISFPSGGFAYFVAFSGLYIAFQWTVHACCVNWWPYPFLELSTPWAPLWYIALALIHVPCYGLYAVIVKAKYSLLPKLFPRAFVRSF